MPSRVGTVMRGISVVAVLSVVAVMAVVITRPGWWPFGGPATPLPLYVAGVAVDADGHVLGYDAAHVPATLPGTRVLAGPGAGSQAAAEASWLAAGSLPGQGTRWASMTRDALLDLHALTPAGGASVAGWAPSWRYVWPRDASFVAVALARTGHVQDAVAVLAFLQGRQLPNGEFEARYRPDRPGVPDGRGIQLDGTGWVLWALGEVADATGPGPTRTELLHRLAPLLDRSAAAAAGLVSGPGHLPPASPDYWEVPEARTTLGTAAPLLAGLRAAGRLQTLRHEDAAARRCDGAAEQLARAVTDRFGAQGYPRHLGQDDPDAAVTFLLPPFAPAIDPTRPAVLAALRTAATRMARPGGGLAPGSGWKRDGVSWTAETALFALAAASTGQRADAGHRLDWLEAHRTVAGSLPEKVLADGNPAGTAPLTWTSAIVILAVQSLDRP